MLLETWRILLLKNPYFKSKSICQSEGTVADMVIHRVGPKNRTVESAKNEKSTRINQGRQNKFLRRNLQLHPQTTESLGQIQEIKEK
jgi:hypothetical protein